VARHARTKSAIKRASPERTLDGNGCAHADPHVVSIVAEHGGLDALAADVRKVQDALGHLPPVLVCVGVGVVALRDHGKDVHVRTVGHHLQ
jgi:hypothetical protein